MNFNISDVRFLGSRKAVHVRAAKKGSASEGAEGVSIKDWV